MVNTCGYSDEWQPYIGDYDEYDIKLKDGTVVENCYPNGGKFNPISDLHDNQSFDGSQVAEIRFSENPRFGINEGVSNRPQYKWLNREDGRVKAGEFDKNNTYLITDEIHRIPDYYESKQFKCKGRHQYREVDGVWICECGRKMED